MIQGSDGSMDAAVLPLSDSAALRIREAVGALRDPVLRASALQEGRLSPPWEQALRILDDEAFLRAAACLRRMRPEAEEARERRHALLLDLGDRYPEAMDRLSAARGDDSVETSEVVTVNVPSNVIIFANGVGIRPGWPGIPRRTPGNPRFRHR